MRKYIIGTIFGFVLATAVGANAQEVSRVIDSVVSGVFPVTVEGNSVGDAIVVNDKTYLPVREFGEAVGYKVTFTEDREVVLTKNVELTSPTTTDPVVTPPVTTVNPRIAEINKELEEWAGKLEYITNEISSQNKVISDLESKLTSKDPIESREAQGSLNFQRPRLEGAKGLKQQAESEIAKLQAELQTLQN